MAQFQAIETPKPHVWQLQCLASKVTRFDKALPKILEFWFLWWSLHAQGQLTQVPTSRISPNINLETKNKPSLT